MGLFEILSLVCLLGSSFVLSAGRAVLRFPERAIRFFIFFALQVVVSGYLASLVNRLGDMWVWALLHVVFLGAAATIFRLRNGDWPNADVLKVARPDLAEWKSEFANLGPLTQGCLALLGLATFFAAGMGALIALNTAPHNWDSMTYHLARVGYYLQQGSLLPFISNYHCQVIYPKASAIIQAYVFLASGRNDHWTQMVQFAAYLVAMASIYGSARVIGAGRIASAAAALTVALMPNILMQATTTQDDLLLASFGSCSLFFMLNIKTEPRLETLWLAVVAGALTLATKFSGPVFLPAFAVLAIFFVPDIRKALGPDAKRLAAAIAALGLTAFALVLPSSYLENILRYGHPSGPEGPRTAITLQDQPIGVQAIEAAKNVVRLSADSWSLEGLPPKRPVLAVQDILRLPIKALENTPLELDRPVGHSSKFIFDRAPRAQEDVSSSGLAGLALAFPAGLLALLRFRRNKPAALLAFGAAAAFAMLCWATTYDPWQGRRLTAVTLIGAPTIALFLDALWSRGGGLGAPSRWRWLGRHYLAGLITLTAISGASAMLFRENANILPLNSNAFHRDGKWLTTDRIAMLTRSKPDMYEPILRFESIVPARSVVAVALPRDQFEFPLFGERLTRTLLPINPFERVPPPSLAPSLLPIPPQAEYLLFFNGYFEPVAGDIDLGRKWHLRNLRPAGAQNS